jgi:asparagine synthase (glutamine-hydrolysing)
MAGLLGIVRREPSPSVGQRFDSGLARMQRHRQLLTESRRDPHGGWAIGRSHLGVLQPAAQGSSAGPISVWLHGDVWNAGELIRTLGLLPTTSITELVGHLYTEHGSDFVSLLEGTYALAVLDSKARRLTLATDTVGSYPLYWQAGATELTFSSDLTALLAMSERKPALDMRAVADYLTIGFVVGDKTLAEGTRLLGPGETLVIDWESGATRVTRRSALSDLFKLRPRSREEYYEALQRAFKESVHRCLQGEHRFALSLSGGLDSRAILAAVNGNTQLSTYTLGIKGCADEIIAERLAAIGKTSHRFFELNDEYLRDFLPNLATMVSLTDGMYLSHGLTEMLALQFISESPGSVLLRGHGGELAKANLAWPLHTDAFVHTLDGLETFVPYLSKRANYLTPNLQLSELLEPPALSRAGRGSADSFAEVLSDLPLSPADACSYLYLREHHRRYTVPSLELFRSAVEVRLPFVVPHFLSVLLSAPPAWRDGTEIHRALTRVGHPALLKVRNSNTGAAADAGPKAEWVMDKFNTLFKRANISGFRHYHNFDAWMRDRLLSTTETELIGPAAATRAYINSDTLARMVHDTRSGAADHGYALQCLLILELWQRENGVHADN